MKFPKTGRVAIALEAEVQGVGLSRDPTTLEPAIGFALYPRRPEKRSEPLVFTISLEDAEWMGQKLVEMADRARERRPGQG